ncbi:MAG: response regulator transcription factor [Myxococcota bacterium]|nr:response regulator transcription factor [Myxococcota bacterium]MEC9441177.1 response regulator transcription factor [Myxococcota bacterium]
MSDQIRILIAEDHQLMREGLRSLLADVEDLRVVGEVADGADAVQLASEQGPDVVIMDVGLPGLNGIDAARQLQAMRPDIHVLMLTMHDDAQTVDRALRAGARGFVLKGGGMETLCEAIRTVHQGAVYFDPGIAHFVLQGYLRSEEDDRDPLTPREREILQLIAEGNTSQDIATRLGIKAKTVQNYRTQIMDKLDVRTTAGLVRVAMKLGLTSESGDLS